MIKINNHQIKELAESIWLSYAHLQAFIRTETPGNGFDKRTGKLLIQFEPHYFRRNEPFAPSGAWSINKVDVQSKEWVAFNDAFKIDPESAMMSTSIGMPQIMGQNFKQCGYSSVGEMWDDFKKGEYNQIKALCTFIINNKALYKAIKNEDWAKCAYIYNGPRYMDVAKKYGREPYDITLKKEFELAKKEVIQ